MREPEAGSRPGTAPLPAERTRLLRGGPASAPGAPPGRWEHPVPSQRGPGRVSLPSLTPSEKGSLAQEPAHHRGCRARHNRGKNGGKEEEPRVRVVSLAPPRPGSGADRRHGRMRTGRGELTPQRTRSAPRTPGKSRAAATAQAKRLGWEGAGRGEGAGGRGRRAAHAPLRAASEPGAFSGSPAPEVQGLPGGTLRWGRGRRERGLRTPQESITPNRSRRGEMVCGGCTYSRSRCCRRHLRCCRQRLKKPHPSACSREIQSLGGAWGPGRPPPPSSRRPELPPAPPTLCPPLRLRPPPRPHAASQPRGRLLGRDSAVSMTPGKHSGTRPEPPTPGVWGRGLPEQPGQR